MKCGQRPIQRAVGCLPEVEGAPDSAAIDGVFDRLVYDAEPYNSCHTEEDLSFRQYLEGFNNEDTDVICVAGGCGKKDDADGALERTQNVDRFMTICGNTSCMARTRASRPSATASSSSSVCAPMCRPRVTCWNSSRWGGRR